MRTILSIITICVMSSGLWAQEKSFEKQVKEISDEITAITESEKSLLKAEVEVINKKVELGELTQEKAAKLKRDASEKRAKNIEDKVSSKSCR